MRLPTTFSIHEIDKIEFIYAQLDEYKIILIIVCDELNNLSINYFKEHDQHIFVRHTSIHSTNLNFLGFTQKHSPLGIFSF